MPDLTRDEAERLLYAFQAAAIDAYTQHDGPSELDTKREQARAAVLTAMTRATPPGWKRELVHKTIAETLRSHRLQHSVDRDGEHYPLLDALTPDGETVAVGQQEIELLTDAIYLELLAAAPEAP